MKARITSKSWFTYQRLALVLALVALTASFIPEWGGGRVLTVSAAAPPACQSILYVNASASGANDGSSWPHAYTSLSAALVQANACPIVTQIWVAKGTYRPDPTGLEDPRAATFTLKNNLAIYGGFTSGQTSLSQRDWNPATNGTVLSGDLSNNDGTGLFDNANDNSYHVVVGSGTDNTAILDGFTITRGWALNLSGGGIWNVTGSPTLTNLIISRNVATFFGAGIENQEESNPTLTNVVISGNSVSGLGGGMCNFSSNPTLTNVVISGNTGTFGENKGGGMANIGSSPTLTNVTISGNSAISGGAMFNDFRSAPIIRNSILWGNSGGEIANPQGNPSVSYSIVQGGYAGTGNLNSDPLFVTAVPTPPSTGGNLRLQSTSPAINGGTNTVPLPATDLEGNPRVSGITVDMGAYEFKAAPTISLATVSPIAGQSLSATTIATITDVDDDESTLDVTATYVSGSGITLTGISINASGNVTANVSATCDATASKFTLQATDLGGLSTTTTLTVNVTPNQLPTLSYPSNPGTTYGTAITVNPLTGPSDDVGVTSVVVQSITPTDPGGIGVDNSGVVTVANTVPVGTYTVTIRANAPCGNKSASFTLGIVKATPTITWNNPADITYGTALSNTQLNATASVDGSFSYNPPSGTVLNAGDGQSLSVTFTPTDTSNYNSASKSVSINVLKATPTITWANPADIVYGTALSSAQLNATANTVGNFTYTPASGTLLNPGSGQSLSVTFVPNDTNNYIAANKTVTINVLKATPTITWNTPADIVYGTALSATQLNATANVEGSFSYSPASGVVLNAGNGQSLFVTFTPTDTSNYSSTSKSVQINVLKVTPIITWTLPTYLLSGALSAAVLNATANVPGTFTYTPIAGTVLPAGSVTLTANFTPSEIGNYNPASQSVTLPVLDNSCGITVNPATLPAATRGTPFVQTLSASPTGSYVFSLLSGALPPGVSLVNTLGIYSLRGTPNASGIYTFTIKAKKNNSTCEGARTYTVVVP